MSRTSRRLVLSCLCILVGYSIFGVYALSLRFHFYFPVEAYWLSFVLVSIPLVCEVAFWGDRGKLRLFYLLSFSLMIHLQYVVVDSSPFLSSYDAVADYRLTNKIVADSQWVPFESVGWGLGTEYRFYPITDFIYATLSLITGIPLLVVVKYLFVVKGLVVPPLVDRWFRGFFNHRVAYLATVLFLASPGAILYPHKECFAVIFFFVGLYASSKIEKNRRYLLIGLISILTLVMTHHFTTYVFLVLLTSLFLASHFYKRRNAIRVSGQFFLLCWIIFAGWIAFIAWTTIAMHQKLFYEAFFGFVLPGQLTFSELLPLYSQYERILVWLGTGIASVSAIVGFLSYIRHRKSFSSSFFAMMVFLIPLLAVATFFRFMPTTYGVLISHRAYEFGYIGVGAFSGLFFVSVFRSRKSSTSNGILIGAIIAVIIAGPIAGGMHPRTFAIVSDVISPEAFSLNAWISESTASNENTIVDKVVKLILTGYGDSTVVTDPEFFGSQNFSFPTNASYVVTYIYMTDFYGPNATKFHNSPYLHIIYTNSILQAYRISNSTSS